MKFDNYLLKLEKEKNKKDKENICINGISKIIKQAYLELKKINKRSLIKKLQNEIDSPYQTIYSWISGSNPAPISKLYILLELWQKELNKSQEDFNEKWNEVYKQTPGYSQNGERMVRLPKEFNENLAYLMGFFQGDGHLAKEQTKRYQEYSLHFFEEHKEFLEQLNKKIKSEFDVKGNIYEEHDLSGRWYRLRICSKPIYLFFKEILGLTSGRKVRHIKVPAIIKDSKQKFQLAFIRGFFDAEGGVGETTKNPWLEIGQASANSPAEILIWTKETLDKNGILLSSPQKSSGQDFFRLRTSKRETIKTFFETISSEHQNKIERFENIIKNDKA